MENYNKSFFINFLKVKFILKQLKPYAFICFIIVIGLVINSCKKEDIPKFSKIGAIKYSPNIAVPLVYSKLSFTDLGIDSSKTMKTADNLVVFVYDTLIKDTSLIAEKVIKIPDQTFQQIKQDTVNLPDFSNYPAPSVTIPYNPAPIIYYPPAETPGQILDSIILKSGTLDYDITTDINHNADIVINVPSITKNGVPYSKKLTYTYGSGATNIIGSEDLTGYKVNFSKTNQITMNYQITAYKDANPNKSPYKVYINLAMKNAKFAKIYGYLDKITVNLKKSLDFDLLKKAGFNGVFSLLEPKLFMTINNSYGAPMIVTFNKFTSSNPPQTVDIAWKPMNIPAPLTLGARTSTKDSVDKFNSNLPAALNILPKQFLYDITAVANPNGVAKNFVLDTSRITIGVRAELPLYGTIKGYTLYDTIKGFNLGKVADSSTVQSGNFLVTVVNKFPLEAYVQLYFTRDDYTIIDSLVGNVKNLLVDGAIPDASGRVTKAVTKVSVHPFNNTKYNNACKATKIIVKSTMFTTNAGKDPVKVFTDYFIDVKVGVNFKLSIGGK